LQKEDSIVEVGLHVFVYLAETPGI
jgi:hypothetical protein